MRVANDAPANDGYCQRWASPAIGLQTIEPRTIKQQAIEPQAMDIDNNGVAQVSITKDVLDHQE